MKPSMISRLPAPASLRLSMLAALALMLAALPARAQHIHLNAGVVDSNSNGQPNAGEPLFFANGDSFSAASGFVINMTYQGDGDYAGHWLTTTPTFTALPATEDFGGPAAFHAALGADIWMKIVSVSGPSGGVFSFWEAEEAAPTLSLAVGVTPVTTLGWFVSENDGEPGSDPFGHVHGRAFTVTAPGTYNVGYILYDVSTNGPGGGPIHTPSAVYTLRYNAIIPEPAHAAALTAGVALLLLRRRRR